MGSVRVEESATICAKLLDCFLAGHWTQCDHLLSAFERGCFHRTLEGLGHPHGHKSDGDDHRNGQKDVECRLDEVVPEVAQIRSAAAREGAREGHCQCDARCCREEVLHREARHLDEIAHGRLTAIGLPVGIGDKAHGGVEGQRLGHGAETLGIEWQNALQTHQSVKKQETQRIEGQHGHRVGLPVLLSTRDAANTTNAGFHGCEHRRQKTLPPEKRAAK